MAQHSVSQSINHMYSDTKHKINIFNKSIYKINIISVHQDQNWGNCP